MYKQFGFPIDPDNPNNNLTVQAYADDILLFSTSKEGLLYMIDCLYQFLNMAKVNLNPHKCELFGTKKISINLADPLNRSSSIEMQYNDLNKTIKYLGIPLGSKKWSKMKSNEKVFQKMARGAERLASSGIKINQLLYSLRTHILPMAEYILRNSICYKSSLTEMDQLIRAILHDKIGGMHIPIDLHYLNTGKGGFGLMNLTDRYKICKIANLFHIFNSEIGMIYRRYLQETRIYLGIDKFETPNLDDPENSQDILKKTFFDWKIASEGKFKISDIDRNHYGP
jgi:hypothetical protein